MSSATINLTTKLYQYLIDHSLREPEILQQLRRETQKKFQINMHISPEQGQFMRMLIKLIGARKTLDIGTFTGYSALAVALELPKDGKVIACDVSEVWTNVAKRFWEQANVLNKIDLKLDPALKTLDSLLMDGEANTYDFAFIDADKQNYIHYYEKALALVRPGGLIAVDNVLWGGRVANRFVLEKDTASIRELNSIIRDDDRVNISMLPIGDGLTLALKK